MDRPGCANVPAFALQLLLVQRPEWAQRPVAVLDKDDPQGLLLTINEMAWQKGLRPGMRYGPALSLERSLRGSVVPAASIVAATGRLVEVFRTLSPNVDVADEEPGIFWLDGRGLGLLYASASAWGRAVHDAIVREGFEGVVVIGFTRFGVYAIARQHGSNAHGAATNRYVQRSKPVVVLATAEEERRAVHAAALERLDVDAKLLETFERLGLRTVGDLLRLPPQGIRRRFGDEAWKLHERASGRAWDPLRPSAAEETFVASTLLDEPVTSSHILLFVVRRLLAPLLERLAAREQAAVALSIALHTDLKRHTSPDAEETVPKSFDVHVRAAAPTLDEAVLLDLVRLRLETLVLPRGVMEIDLEVEAGAADREQLRLFAAATRRDLRAGERALARVRAEFGENSVVHAALREGHLPEAQFTWEPMTDLPAAQPRVVRVRPLVRRFYSSVVALPSMLPSRERDDWIEAAGGHGRIEAMIGPYIVSGGWWLRQLHSEVHREYHYARTESGELLWMYYDRRRRRWFLQGCVE